MKKDTILFDLLQCLIPEEEVKSIFESHGYKDTARKFGVFSLLQFWIAVALGEWKSFRESEEQLKGRSWLPLIIPLCPKRLPLSLLKDFKTCFTSW
jgi:hypothetical protein